MTRISIAGVLGFVAVFALGLTALIRPSDAWAGAIFTMVLGMLLASVLGTLLRGWRRGGWLGFALFGWGFFLFGSVPGLGMVDQARLLPYSAASWVFETSNPYDEPQLPPILPSGVSPFEVDTPAPAPPSSVAVGTPIDLVMEYNSHIVFDRYVKREATAELIGYWLSIPLSGCLGAILGVLLARPQPKSGGCSGGSADRRQSLSDRFSGSLTN
jgi:hypothetical protein